MLDEGRSRLYRALLRLRLNSDDDRIESVDCGSLHFEYADALGLAQLLCRRLGRRLSD